MWAYPTASTLGRNDAGLAAAELALAVEAAALGTAAPDTVATAGRVDLAPNTVNSVPREVPRIACSSKQLPPDSVAVPGLLQFPDASKFLPNDLQYKDFDYAAHAGRFLCGCGMAEAIAAVDTAPSARALQAK